MELGSLPPMKLWCSSLLDEAPGCSLISARSKVRQIPKGQLLADNAYAPYNRSVPSARPSEFVLTQ